jgi:PAS domain S-box-containing protein
MGVNIAKELVLNLSLLVTLSVLSGFVERRWSKEALTGKILQGLLFGFVAIVGMIFSFKFTEGLIFDGRTIVISLCTLFFGPLSGLISALLSMIYRIWIGGVGLPMGLLKILEAFVIGYVFHYLKIKYDVYWLTLTRLYLFGLLVHAIMVALIFTLPLRLATDVLHNLGLIIIIVYPIITVLIGKILFDQEVGTRYVKDIELRESLYRTTLYSIGDAVITTDSRGIVRNMNSVAESLTGWLEKEASGKEIGEVFNIVNEFTLEKAENPVSRVLREGKVVGLANHTVLISKDGRKIPIADSGAPIKDFQGNILGVVLVFRDQTKEREYLRKIEESEKRYRQFVYFSTDGIWRFDLEKPIPINLPIAEQIKMMFEGGVLAECNDVYAKMYGFDKAEEIVGIRLTDVMKEDSPENIEYLTAFIQNGYKLTGGISKEVDRYGNIKYFENNLVGIIEGDALVRAWGTQKDITEKYLLEEELRESEERFRLLAEASLVGIYLIQDYKFAYVNKALADVFGYDVDEVIGKLGPLDLTHPDDHPKVIENINKRVSGEIEAINYSFKGVRKDGTAIYVEVFGRRIEYKGKPGVIGTLMDITERVKLEQENRIKTEQLQNTLENTPNVAIQFYDERGRITYWNNASTRIYGWTKEEALGKTLDELIWSKEQAEEFLSILQKIKETKQAVGPFESKFHRKDGTEGWILSTTFVIPSETGSDTFVCMDVEITEQKKAYEELNQQKELFKTLIETSNVAILHYSGEKVLFCNEYLTKLTGYSREEVYSMPSWNLVHPDQREAVKNNLLRRLSGEPVPSHYEIKILCKDGSAKWVDYSVNLVEFEGKIIAFGTGVDITERKLNEEVIKIQNTLANALLESPTLNKFFEIVRNELSKLIDTKNLFVAFYDERTDELYSPFEWDEKMDAPVRWSAQKSLTGKVVHEKRTIFLKRKEIDELIEKGEIERIGSPAEVWLGVPLFVEGEVYGAIVVQSYDNPNAYDERSKQLLEMVASHFSSSIIRKREHEELVKLSRAVEKSQVGVVITNRDGIIEYVNPKFCEITRYSADELIGRNPRILQSGYHTKEFYKNLWDTILSGRDWVGEFRNKRKGGELYWDRGLISPITDETGKITHFVGIKEDITEQKRLIEELVKAREKAQESERLKTAFLANVSHEVRTPLNSIIGFAQVLDTQDLNKEEVKRFASIILKRGNDLLDLFNEILDLSLIESNQLKISPKKVNINSILYDVYSNFLLNPKVKEKQIDLRIGKIFPEDFEFSTDPLRLKQILSNLVENGIKFTKRGYVEFGGTIENENTLSFYVKDTGIGIPASKFNTIFERFQQIDSDFITREYEGTGLGLPLCKGLVNLLGGRIWLESTVGEGTTFYFTISSLEMKPEREKGIEMKIVETPKQLEGQSFVFLVGEDDYLNYLLLEKMLQRNFNCEVLYGATGKDVLNILKERKNIDLILLDLRMPVMDGFTAFQEIKKLDPTVPVIAVTAYAYSEDRKKAIDMGFDEYIVKPIMINDMLAKINQILLKKKKK